MFYGSNATGRKAFVVNSVTDFNGGAGTDWAAMSVSQDKIELTVKSTANGTLNFAFSDDGNINFGYAIFNQTGLSADRSFTLPNVAGTFALTSDLHTQNTDTGTTADAFTLDSDDTGAVGGGILYGGTATGRALLLLCNNPDTISAGAGTVGGVIGVTSSNVYMQMWGATDGIKSIVELDETTFKISLTNGSLLEMARVEANKLYIIDDAGNEASIDPDALTASRAFALPDVAGTFALTSDLKVTTEGDLLTVDNSSDLIRLPRGTDGQYLKVSGTALAWAAAPGGSSPLTTKGDLYGYDTGDARLPVGSNGQVLMANDVPGIGLSWTTPSWLPLTGGAMTGAITGLTALNTHTIPGGTGTLALTSDLSSFIEATDVTYGNLDSNGDVGTSAGQLAIGDHTHSDLHTQNTDTGTDSTTFEINNGGSGAILSTTGLTADRTLTFPDASVKLQAEVYDAVVGSGQEYTTLGAAATAGANSIFIKEGTTTETGAITMPANCTVVFENQNAIVNLGTNVLTTAADNKFIGGTIQITINSASTPIVIGGDDTIFDDVYFKKTGAAPAASTYMMSDAGTARKRWEVLNCTIELANDNANEKGIYPDSTSTKFIVDNLKIVGGGTNTKEIVKADASYSKLSNIQSELTLGIQALWLEGANHEVSNVSNMGITSTNGATDCLLSNSHLTNLNINGGGWQVSNCVISGTLTVYQSNNTKFSNCDVTTGFSNNIGGGSDNLSFTGCYFAPSFTLGSLNERPKFDNCTFDGDVTLSADGGSISNCAFPTASLTVGGDNARIIGNVFGNGAAGGGSDTITLNNGINAPHVIGNHTDAAIVDSGATNPLPATLTDLNSVY